MVVDDETDLLVITSKMLNQNGYTVHAFESPAKALIHVKDNACKDCSIVISDIRMPGMSGFDLVRQIKEQSPEIRIILMTAFNINKEEAQIISLSTKINAFLNKPFATAQLMQALKECLSMA